MRIMQIASGGRTVNGALQYAVQLSKRLSERGHDVWMLCPDNSYVADAIADTAVRHIASDLRRWPLDELKRIRNLIRSEGIEVVHGHSSRAFNFGVCLRRLFGVPCVSTAHSNKIQIHWCLADHVIAVSQATRSFHRRWNAVRPSRIAVIHNPIDTERFRPVPPAERLRIREQLELAPEAMVLLIAGHIIRRKGQLTAVRALPGIVARFPQAMLLLVGHESHEYGQEVRREIDRLQLQPYVRWMPSRDDIENIYAIADVCLCPSLDEPFGLTACEAMACEVPVVASRLGGFLETVQEHETGLFVPSKNPAALAEATLEWLEQPERRRAGGRQGRQWVADHLSAAVHDSAIEQVYRSVSATCPQLVRE